MPPLAWSSPLLRPSYRNSALNGILLFYENFVLENIQKSNRNFTRMWKTSTQWNKILRSQTRRHTSGHANLDAERGSCLMNTHWNTAWNTGYHRALSLFSSTAWCGSSTANFTFPGLEFESKSWQFLWLQWQLLLINQSIKLFKQIFSIDWPL